jgi:lipoprotein-anchoring transpeptidase ErfK/SrfK
MKQAIVTLLASVALIATPLAIAQEPPNVSPPLIIDKVNNTALPEIMRPGVYSDAALKAQILLDRAYFSPGQIDGRYGGNMRKALAGYQLQKDLPVTGKLDKDTWIALNDNDGAPVLGTYEMAEEDVSGPFIKPYPKTMAEQAKLPCSCYSSPEEGLGEKYHVSPEVLKKLNPDKSYDQTGTVIVVPIVRSDAPAVRATSVVVTKHDKTVRALDKDGHVLAQYPATIGSLHDPLPLGSWKIMGVARHPEYHYSPKYFWNANPMDEKAVIPKGPNNPVGVVWIQLSKPNYGIHGTPDPAKISTTESHGCIRLTNWDAWELAKMVRPGTPAILQD